VGKMKRNTAAAATTAPMRNVTPRSRR